MGDFNAAVGEGVDGKVVGKYGLGKRNDRGQMLVEFCKRNQLVVTNTWFQQEKRRRYTGKSPRDKGRYQIDYILVRQRYRNGVKRSWSYPGADAYTDHNLVAMQMHVKLKKISRARARVRKWDIEHLKKNIGAFQKSVEESLKSGSGMEINQRWIELTQVIVSSARKEIGYEKGTRKKKPWITEEMKSKMDERRKWKNRNTEDGQKELQ